MQISQVVQRYHNPDPLLRLIGLANEATIIVEGQRFLALIDSGVQLSMMSELLVQALKLPVHKHNTLIEAEASGGGVIPHVGYVEARLAIPGIKKMEKDLASSHLKGPSFVIDLATSGDSLDFFRKPPRANLWILLCIMSSSHEPWSTTGLVDCLDHFFRYRMYPSLTMKSLHQIAQ